MAITLSQLISSNQNSLSSYLNKSNQLSLSKNQSLISNDSKESEKDNGNGGLYLIEKAGLGFLSGIEGIWDYAAGGIAKLAGADDWAEEQFDNDWVNYNHADEWYNPSDGWKVAGDVAGGIGTSLPSLVGVGIGVGIAYVSHGTLTPLAASIIAGSIGGLSAAGNATKEAYRETGELGAKEFGYGALTGTIAGAGDAISTGLGKGMGRIASSLANTTAKGTAKTVIKSGAKTVFKNLAGDFAQEALEEGLEEALSPVFKRMTYDPDAENATAQEIGYAALIGGLSGAIMSGAGPTVNTTANFLSGKKAVKNGSVNSILKTAEYFSQYEAENDTGYESFRQVKQSYDTLTESLKTTGGMVSTVKQKMLLGEIKRANTVSTFMPFVERSAMSILADPENVANRYNEFGMADSDGKALKFTAEQIRSGIDAELLRKKFAGSISTSENRTLVKQIRKALTTNSVLTTLSVADATGHITMNTQKFADAALSGKKFANSADLNTFIERGSDEQKAALGKKLGIFDWNTVNLDQFQSSIDAFSTGEEGVNYAQQIKRIRTAKEMAQESSKPLPHILRRNMSDGAYKFSSENSDVNMAVLKEGENYFLFNYDSEDISRPLKVSEVNKVLREFWNTQNNSLLQNQTQQTSTPENNELLSTRFALKKDANGEPIVEIDNEIVTVDTSPNQIAKTLSEVVRTKFADLIKANGQAIGINQRTAREWVRSKSADTLRRFSKQTFIDKVNAFGNADELLIASKNYIGEAIKHTRKDNFTEFARGVVSFKTNEKIYDADIIVGTTKSGAAVLYDIVNIQNKKMAADTSYTVQDRRSDASATNSSISQITPKNNPLNKISQKNLSPIAPTSDTTNRQALSEDTNVNAQDSTKQKLNDIQEKLSLDRLDSLAKEKISDYHKLSEPNKQAVRMTLRQAQAHGMTEADALTFARVAARSGKNIVFDTNLPQGIDADTAGNTIRIDPNAPKERLRSRLLLHEAGHSLLKLKGGKNLIAEAFRHIAPERSQEVAQKYIKLYKTLGKPMEQYMSIVNEEITMAYTEDVLGDLNAWEYILAEEPTLKDKFLSFFRKAAQDYSSDQEMSAEARKLLRKYKKLFNELSEINQGNNVLGEAIQVQREQKASTESAEVRYALDYDEAIDKLDNGTLDIHQNTHLKVLQHTPKIYIEKAGASDREIVMSWDIAYLAMNKDGNISGNYHGLGTEIMKSLPRAIEDPLYIVKQKNGRIAAVTKIVVKGKRAVFASIELEAFQTTIQEGKTKANRYNLVVTVTDAKPNYLQNTIFSGDIVHNKNNEDPAHFILRLKSLEKAVPTYDLAESSKDSITENKQKSNTSDENSQKIISNKRFALSENKDNHSSLTQNIKIKETASDGNVSLSDIVGGDPLNKMIIAKGLPFADEDGQYHKKIANKTKNKVFHKQEVRELVSKFNGADILSKTTIDEIANSLFILYNKAPDLQTMKAYSNDIAEFMVSKITDDIKTATFGAERAAMIKGLGNEILQAYKIAANRSDFARRVEQRASHYRERADYWKAMHDNIKGYDRMCGILMSKAQQMKDLKLEAFSNATQVSSDIFKHSIEQLSRLKYRENLNKQGARTIFANVHQWYSTKEVKELIFNYQDDKNPGLYSQGIADMLSEISNGDGDVTKDELRTMYNVMSYFTNFVKNWGKVFRQGKWIEAKPEAERYINTLHANEKLKVGLFSKLAGTTYMQTFGDPMTVARRMDMYESGFFTEIMTELRDAAEAAAVAEMEIRTEYDAFVKKNKRYVEKTSREIVSYNGTELSKMQLISLYMTMKRKQAWAGLLMNGFAFNDSKGKKVRVNGTINPQAKLTPTELEQYAKRQVSSMEALLTATDKEYLAILEKVYNEDARNLKANRDIERLGFTNATVDYYYPIRRSDIAKSVDTSEAESELDRVSNASFNKNTVEGAKQKLFIESADAVFTRHLRAVCQYAYVSPAVDTYNVLYNLDISGNKNNPVSVRTESENTWKKGNEYFKKLISDVQGIPAAKSEGMKTIGFIRGSYAKYQLGANPKVWATQFSSLAASSALLDGDSIVKGLAFASKDVIEYCSLAKLRKHDNTAAVAQGSLDSNTPRTINAIGKFSDALMAPIGATDSLVIRWLFGACQVQVQKDGGAKIGTTENKIAAGEMLRTVILETQQNSLASERSAATRSSNEIVRTLTMFRSDAIKVIGRVIDGFGEISVLKSKLKTESSPQVKAELKVKLKTANQKTRKSVTALALSSVLMATIAQGFRLLYDKEKDEDKTVAETMTLDAVGNMFGGLPIISDAIARFTDGYNLENYTYSAINDLFDSAMDMVDVAGSFFTNEGSMQERNRAIRNLAYSTGQILGLPVRNVYNTLYGLTKRFSPETAYVIDNAFYEKNYQNDLYKAIESGDDQKTTWIMSILLGERIGEDIDKNVYNEILSLSKNGQKVIPRSIPETITVNDTEYTLSEAEKANIKDIYSQAQTELKSLFSKSKYNSLSNEQKTDAIDFVYDIYYNKAINNALGINDDSNNSIISSAIGADNLALLHTLTKGITSDTDEQGNVISGSKRKKVVDAINSLDTSKPQKLLLIAAKGYSLQDNDIRGISAEKAKKYLLKYIFSLKVSKNEKAQLAELCGFKVLNGRVITNDK